MRMCRHENDRLGTTSSVQQALAKSELRVQTTTSTWYSYVKENEFEEQIDTSQLANTFTDPTYSVTLIMCSHYGAIQTVESISYKGMVRDR